MGIGEHSGCKLYSSETEQENEKCDNISNHCNEGFYGNGRQSSHSLMVAEVRGGRCRVKRIYL